MLQQPVFLQPSHTAHVHCEETELSLKRRKAVEDCFAPETGLIAVEITIGLMVWKREVWDFAEAKFVVNALIVCVEALQMIEA